MNIYILGLIIPFFSFILQVWPRLKNRYYGIDTWRHLMYAEYIRKYKKLPEKITDRYLVDAPSGYPPFILILLSLFPKRLIDTYQFLFSPAVDFLHNYFIFLVAFFLSQNIISSMLAQIIAALTPVVVIEASNLSTRTLSHFIFNLSFLSLLFFTATGNIYFMFFAFVLLFLLFFTHKLAIQAYLFQLIGFTFYERTLIYLVFFIGVFIIVLIVGGRIYRFILRDHLTILNFWRKNIHLRFAHQIRGIPKKNEAVDFVQKVYLLSVKSPLIYILGSNPWLGFYVISLFINFSRLISIPVAISPDILNKFHAWVLISIGSAFMTLAVKQLRFLGEGQRYLEYAVLPLAILLGSAFNSLFNQFKLPAVIGFTVICIIFGITIIYLQIKTVLHDRARTVSKELWEIIHYLNKTDGKRVRLLILPFNLGDAMMYFLKGKVLTTDSGVGLLSLTDIFPVFRKPVSEIVKKYQVNYVVVDEKFVTIKELKLKKFKEIYNQKGYHLLKI